MIRSILVPLDGSTFGEHALPWAMSIARRARAGVEILHVHRPLEATYSEMQVFDDTLGNQLRARERTYLETTLRNLNALDLAPVTSACKDGEVSTTIREHAKATKTDLIVMTTHARGAVGRFWLGSATDELLRDPPAPMLLIHPNEKEVDAKENRVFQHLLVPLDGTPFAEQILGPATVLAELMSAEMTLLRVITPVMPMSLPTGANSFGAMVDQMLQRVDELHEQLKKEAHEYLERVATGLRAKGLTVQTQIVIEDQPAIAILQRATAPIDLIALETHGRRGLYRLFLGSAADKVIRGAHVPILAHRPTH